MPGPRTSLLGGRNSAPLDDGAVRRAVNIFLGMDDGVVVRYEASSKTIFRVAIDTGGLEYGEIVFGPDIYPGSSVVDPNSALSVDAAAAHELTHYYRWRDKTQLTEPQLEHLDEALTSLQAIARYERSLREHDVRQLVYDAIQRIQLYLQSIREAGQANEGV
jgi:hypothetical protein